MKKIKSSKSKNSKTIKPGGAVEYIARCPKEAQVQLKNLRTCIRKVAPDAIETVSYFDVPGYSYEGYEYNGMFAWFSFKDSFARLHIRPNAILKFKKDLEKYTTTKAIVSFSIEKSIPQSLVKKLVKASLKDMLESK